MVSQILTYFLFVVVFIQFLSHFLSSYKNKAHNDQEQQQRKSKWKISDHIHVPSLTKRKEDSSITFDPLTIDNDQSEQSKEKKIKLKWGQVPYKNTLPKRRKGQMDEDKYKDRGDVNYKLRNKNRPKHWLKKKDEYGWPFNKMTVCMFNMKWSW